MTAEKDLPYYWQVFRGGGAGMLNVTRKRIGAVLPGAFLTFAWLSMFLWLMWVQYTLSVKSWDAPVFPPLHDIPLYATWLWQTFVLNVRGLPGWLLLMFWVDLGSPVVLSTLLIRERLQKISA